MAQPVGGTVVIQQIEGTTLWIWARHVGVTMLATLPDGSFGDETVDVVHSVGANFPYPDSASALAHAKAVNADLAEDAFIVN